MQSNVCRKVGQIGLEIIPRGCLSPDRGFTRQTRKPRMGDNAEKPARFSASPASLGSNLTALPERTARLSSRSNSALVSTSLRHATAKSRLGTDNPSQTGPGSCPPSSEASSEWAAAMTKPYPSKGAGASRTAPCSSPPGITFISSTIPNLVAKYGIRPRRRPNAADGTMRVIGCARTRREGSDDECQW
jgi:hypothetical protein